MQGPPDVGARRLLGERAEQAAADYLVARGFELLAHNRRVGRLEVDLVVRDGPVVAVVEVRARGPGSWQRPLDSVDAGKRQRLRRAGATLWRAWLGRLPGVERMRFDIAAVHFLADGSAIVEHVTAAF